MDLHLKAYRHNKINFERIHRFVSINLDTEITLVEMKKTKEHFKRLERKQILRDEYEQNVVSSTN